MNCKPGDLAVIVSVDGNPRLKHMIGSIRRLISIEQAWDGPAWTYEGKRFRACGLTCYAIPDAWLRPIRPHGDDEEDQRFAPKPEEVTA